LFPKKVHFVFVYVLVVFVFCRAAPIKKLNACPDGGFAKLQLRLLANGEVKCNVCKQLMETYKFSSVALAQAIDDWLAGKPVLQPVADAPEAQAQREPEKETSNAEVEQSSRPEKETSIEEAEQSSRDAAIAYIQSMEFLTPLPSGGFGKKVPVRCSICRTKAFPEGKILEMSALKLNMVRHFVTQHVRSSTHYRHSVAREQEAEAIVCPEMASCEGLCIDDERAGKLFLHKKEFGLWASFANFEGCAVREYWQKPNSTSWCMRSQRCEKQQPGVYKLASVVAILGWFWNV